jgi:hypothetical protein
VNCWIEWSTLVANFATIVTAVVVVWAWSRFRWNLRKKRKTLENYLRSEKQNAQGTSKKGAHFVPVISKETGLTESEIFQLSDESNHIERLVHVDKTGAGDKILFLYKD